MTVGIFQPEDRSNIPSEGHPSSSCGRFFSSARRRLASQSTFGAFALLPGELLSLASDVHIDLGLVGVIEVEDFLNQVTLQSRIPLVQLIEVHPLLIPSF